MSVVGLRHVGITVRDLAISVAFYRDYLGLTVSAEYQGLASDYIRELVGESEAVIDITILTAPDGAKVELLCYRSHPVTTARDNARAVANGRPHLAFSVSNLADLYARREEAGCVFKSAPLRSPDGVLVAYAHDPDGAILELVQPQEMTR